LSKWIALAGFSRLRYGPRELQLDVTKGEDETISIDGLAGGEWRIPMKCDRVRRYAFGLTGLILIPPLLWIAIVLMAPTAWARRRVIAALEARSGRSVSLERLAVPLFGGVELTGLAFGSPKNTNDPWLKAEKLRLNISVCELLQGKIEPCSIEIDGSVLRVLRRADGSLELADFILPPPKESGTRGRADGGPEKISILFHSATVTVIDEPSKTLLHLQNVEGDGAVEGRRVVVQNVRGTLNGGPFQFSGQLDRSGEEPTLEARLRADRVVLDNGMRLIRYAVPVLAGVSLDLKGHVDADLYLHGKGKTWESLSRSLAGHGLVAINPIDLDGSAVVAELSKIAELKEQGGAASIKTDFLISNRRITTDHFVLDVGRVPMALSGWTDFDGRIDYRINLKGLNDRLPDKARHFLSDLNVDLQSLRVLTLQGTVNKMVVHLNGVALDRDLLREAGINVKKQDREKLRILGRRLLDEIVR
jgi:AsmA-like C-terminal region